MSLTPDIERVLAEHQERGTGCDCGWRTSIEWLGGPAHAPWPKIEAEHRAHVADHLAALLGQHVEAAKREAWDEGYDAAYNMARRWGHVVGWEDPEPTNPYRAGGGAAGGGES